MLRVGLLLCRNPLKLPELNEFTAAYLQYRQDLEALAAREFKPEFYFKKGTTAEEKWHEAQKLSEGLPVQPMDELPDRERVIVDESLPNIGRKQDRKLYYLAKESEKWQLASFALDKDELLWNACKSRLESLGQFDSWIVGRAPVGHLESQNALTFFMKAYILSREFAAKHKEYAWATKEECQEMMDKDYYSSVQAMLTRY